MRLYEYEGKILAKEMGIKVPRGKVVTSGEEAATVARDLDGPVVLKAQVLTGGRGKAGGIRFAQTPAEAGSCARELLGSTIKGHSVKTLLVEEKLAVAGEFYAGITYDEIIKHSVFLVTQSGGMEVEELATESGVVREYLDPFVGLPLYKARKLAKRLGLSGNSLHQGASVLLALYNLYKKYDAATAEINPLVLTSAGEVYAADMRVDIDDDALYRQQKLNELGIPFREERGREPTELEQKAATIDKMDYRGVAGRVVEFDGDIALIIGGGGASLTIFDAIMRFGGRPANYCEIGGNPTVTKVKELTKLLIFRVKSFFKPMQHL